MAVFEPPLGHLEATYDDHLRLIGKRVVDFLFALTELFSLGVTAESLRAIVCSKSAISLQRGPVDPKFQVQGVALPNYSFSQKTRLNDLSCGIKIWTDFSSVLSQLTRLTDGQTDRRTDILNARPRLHSMQRGKKLAKMFLLYVLRNSANSDEIGVAHKFAKVLQTLSTSPE